MEGRYTGIEPSGGRFEQIPYLDSHGITDHFDQALRIDLGQPFRKLWKIGVGTSAIEWKEVMADTGFLCPKATIGLQFSEICSAIGEQLSFCERRHC